MMLCVQYAYIQSIFSFLLSQIKKRQCRFVMGWTGDMESLVQSYYLPVMLLGLPWSSASKVRSGWWVGISLLRSSNDPIRPSAVSAGSQSPLLERVLARDEEPFISVLLLMYYFSLCRYRPPLGAVQIVYIPIRQRGRMRLLLSNHDVKQNANLR